MPRDTEPPTFPESCCSRHSGHEAVALGQPQSHRRRLHKGSSLAAKIRSMALITERDIAKLTQFLHLDSR